MVFWRKHRPQTFDAWLDQATRGLCDFAKTQVREEYEDHFTAAYEQLRAEGMDETQAAETAVQSLGRTRHVRRQLKKVYLTRSQEKFLERMLEGVHDPLTSGVPVKFRLSWGIRIFAGMLIGAPFILGLGVFGIFTFQGSQDAMIGLVILVALVCGVAGLVVAKKLLARFNEHQRTLPLEHAIERSLKYTLFFDVFWYGTILAIVFDSGWFILIDWIWFIIIPPYLLVDTYSWRIRYHIARKLRRYPSQNATPVVVKLREAYGKAARNEAGQ